MRDIKMSNKIVKVFLDGYGFTFPMDKCDYETEEMFTDRAKEYLETYMKIETE